MVHTVSAQNVQNNLRNFFEVRGVVAKFIETEYSDIKKVEEYLHDCHRLILREIRHISALPITYGEKVDCFEMMLNDPFCARLLDGSKPYEVILKFLKFRWHHFVIWGSKIGYSVLFAWKQLRQQFQ